MIKTVIVDAIVTATFNGAGSKHIPERTALTNKPGICDSAWRKRKGDVCNESGN